VREAQATGDPIFGTPGIVTRRFFHMVCRNI